MLNAIPRVGFQVYGRAWLKTIGESSVAIYSEAECDGISIIAEISPMSSSFQSGLRYDFAGIYRPSGVYINDLIPSAAQRYSIPRLFDVSRKMSKRRLLEYVQEMESQPWFSELFLSSWIDYDPDSRMGFLGIIVVKYFTSEFLEWWRNHPADRCQLYPLISSDPKFLAP